MLKRVILLAVAVFAMALSGATLRFKSDNSAVSDGIWFTDEIPSIDFDMDLNAKITSQFSVGEQMPYFCFALQIDGLNPASDKWVDLYVEFNYKGRIFEHWMGMEFEDIRYDYSTDTSFAKVSGFISIVPAMYAPPGNYTVSITGYYDGLQAYATKTLKMVNSSISLARAIGCNDAIQKGWATFRNDTVFPWQPVPSSSAGHIAVSGLVGKNEKSILSLMANRDIYVEYSATKSNRYNEDTFKCYHSYGTSAQSLLFVESGDFTKRNILLTEGENASFVYERDSTDLQILEERFGAIKEMSISPVVDVSFNSAGGSLVLPIKCVSGKTYDFLCEKYGKWSFPENGPNPPRKEGVEYKFLGWYNSAGQRITGASIVPDKAEDHVLTARWETSEPLPDLVVSSASVSKTRISRSESVVVSCRVENQGNSSAARSTTIFNCAGKTRSASCLALSPGEGWECSATFSGSALGVGTHTIIITADGASIVGESDDNNNSRSVTVTVVDEVTDNSRPDLIVASAYVSKSSIDISESVTVFCKVKNS